MIATFRDVGRLAFLGGVVIALSTSTAQAQKSGGAGGGGGVGGGGGLKTTTVSLAGSYYAVGSSGSTVAKGSAVLTYDTAQVTRSLTIQLSNVNLPDGTVLDVIFTDDGLTTSTTYYGGTFTTWVPQSAGVLVVYGGTASGSISTANGDNVPLFGTQGRVAVNTVDAAGNSVANVLSGSYLSAGGKLGSRP